MNKKRAILDPDNIIIRDGPPPPIQLPRSRNYAAHMKILAMKPGEWTVIEDTAGDTDEARAKRSAFINGIGRVLTNRGMRALFQVGAADDGRGVVVIRKSDPVTRDPSFSQPSETVLRAMGVDPKDATTAMPRVGRATPIKTAK